MIVLRFFCLFLIFFWFWIDEGEGHNILEDVLEPEADYSDLLADLEANPIDLNVAEVSDLIVIPWLSRGEAQSIVDFRRRHGRFQSMDGLFKVKGLDPEAIEGLRPYVTVAKSLPINLNSRLRLRQKSSVEGELPQSSGIYQRVALSVGERSDFGLLVEKDPGEEDFTDFVAGYAQFQGLWGIDQIVIGDFRPGFGQGLVFSRWAWSASGPDLIKKRDSSSVGYRSSDENGALRGLFLRKSAGKVETAAFLSYSKFDASLNSDGTAKTFASGGGYHTTETEKSKKDRLSEKLVGCRLLWGAKKTAKLGVIMAASFFDPPFKNYDLERKRFAFEGSENRLFSLDWDVDLQGLNLFGEAAFCQKGSRAAVLGVGSDFDKIRILALVRSYGRNFHSLHGSGFSASGGDVDNEIGTFSSITWRPAKGTEVAAYFDQYRHPWRRYREVLPTWGDKLGLRIQQQLFKRGEIVVSLKSKYSQWNKEVIGCQKKNVRFDGRWNLNRKLRLRARFEKAFVKFDDSREEEGTSLFGDLHFNLLESLSIYGRLTLFETDSYDSRIYEFENDHRGTAFPKFVYGKGRKWYVLMTQRIRKNTVSAKYWWEKTQRGRRSEFSAQVDICLHQ